MQSQVLLLTEQEQDRITNYYLGMDFPWYRYTHQTHTSETQWPNPPFFAHTLRSASQQENLEGKINSPHYEFWETIFLRNVAVTPRLIYRAAVNCVGFSPALHSQPHYDHSWPHKHWICYLTNGGPTYFLDHEHTVTDHVNCEKNTHVTFNGQLHAQGFPQENQQRIVVVFTFR